MSDGARFDPEQFGAGFHDFMRWTQEFAGGERSEVSVLIHEFLGPEACEHSVVKGARAVRPRRSPCGV